jgi:hypothetical protein
MISSSLRSSVATIRSAKLEQANFNGSPNSYIFLAIVGFFGCWQWDFNRSAFCFTNHPPKTKTINTMPNRRKAVTTMGLNDVAHVLERRILKRKPT